MKRKSRIKKTVTLVDILDKIIEEYNLEKLFTIESIKAIWPDIVGDIIASHSVPERIFGDTLYINVDHSVYGNELIMIKDQIIIKIKEKNRLSTISKIRVVVKKLIWN